MLQINPNNNITLTKGDTMTLEVELTKDGEPYEPVEGDTLRFALSKGYVGQSGYELIMTKAIPTDTLKFTVAAAETEVLQMTTYVYDVEITHSDGAVDTIISGKLTITGEAE